MELSLSGNEETGMVANNNGSNDILAQEGQQMFSSFSLLSSPSSLASDSGNRNKRKRRPAGTPDPDAEVVALSPKTLMESDRYVCEICNQGFQRDQNLQMHRRRHKVPWMLLKRSSEEVRKRVYVCPDPSCLHHHPSHALGDLVGIKKHYRRKHSSERQWKCDKCSKGYAVQSDYKAHVKTCGTRGHCCDCGRVFSRMESFIEHQDTCRLAKEKAALGIGSSYLASSLASLAQQPPQQNYDLATTRSSSIPNAGLLRPSSSFHYDTSQQLTDMNDIEQRHELQFLPNNTTNIRDNIALRNNQSSIASSPTRSTSPESPICHQGKKPPALQLSIGLSNYDSKQEENIDNDLNITTSSTPTPPPMETSSNFFPPYERQMPSLSRGFLGQTWQKRSEKGSKGSFASIDEDYNGRRSGKSGNSNSSSGVGIVEMETGVVVGTDGRSRSSWNPYQQKKQYTYKLGEEEDAEGEEEEEEEREPTPTTSLEGSYSRSNIRQQGHNWTKEEARKELEEAQRELKRAEELRKQAKENLKSASNEKSFAEQAREQAKRLMEIADSDLTNAQRIREQAQSELAKAHLMKEKLSLEIDKACRLEFTCRTCRQKLKWPDHQQEDTFIKLFSPSHSYQAMNEHGASESLHLMQRKIPISALAIITDSQHGSLAMASSAEVASRQYHNYHRQPLITTTEEERSMGYRLSMDFTPTAKSELD